MNNYFKYISLGLMMVTPAMIGLLFGVVLDRALNAFPMLTLVFLFLGIMSGLWSVYKTLKILE
jgi:F0F1-type ATP synthase assembly protein I